MVFHPVYLRDYSRARRCCFAKRPSNADARSRRRFCWASGTGCCPCTPWKRRRGHNFSVTVLGGYQCDKCRADCGFFDLVSVLIPQWVEFYS